MCPVTSVRLQCETVDPNISIVSSTSDKWSINEFTDTRRIRASSADHLLKQRCLGWARGMAVTPFDILTTVQRSFLHRQRAARQRELFSYAAFPRLPVRGERAQSNGGLLRGRKGNVQRTVREVKEGWDVTSAYLWTTAKSDWNGENNILTAASERSEGTEIGGV